MIKKSNFYILLILILVLLIVVYFLFFFPEEPVEWKPENALLPVPAVEINDGRDVESLVRAIDNSIKYFEKIERGTGTGIKNPQQLMVPFGKEQVSVACIKKSLQDFKTQLVRYGLTPEFFRYVNQNYRFFQSASRNDVLFTGYFEADLRGSLTPSSVYRYPLYRKPGDLYRVDLSSFSFFKEYKGLPRTLRGRLITDGNNRTVIPYYTRDEIDYQQKLSDKKLEIVWIDDLIDVFFLHIQGSGIVTLDNGEILRVNYDESNGHPYRAIGKLLVEQEIIPLENISMQSIREYLMKHPDQIKDILITNPSYIFFREVKEGPIGAIGVPVTAFRSIALDRYLFPKGALCYLKTQLPVFNEQGKLTGWTDYSGFVLNQDTGGAIRSPGRVDLFTGYGKESKLIAGHMKQYGTFYFLIKK